MKNFRKALNEVGESANIVAKAIDKLIKSLKKIKGKKISVKYWERKYKYHK